MEEHNFFELLDGMNKLYKRICRRHLTAFCKQNRAGWYTAGLLLPIKLPVLLLMALSALYLGSRLLTPGPFWGAAWPSGFLIVCAVAALLAGGVLLRFRYTITDTELIMRSIGVRRICLMDLHCFNEAAPPEMEPGKQIRFYLGGGTFTVLRFLGFLEGSFHFVMLLGQAAELNLIEPYLGKPAPVRPVPSAAPRSA